ncbi:MAG: hypothetical protein HY720_08215 [Planctomycetes bacterium]|nr:hypothetical protein [Planctomycetota bacterium]
MLARPRIRRLSLVAMSILLSFLFAPLSADRPPDSRVRLRVPTTVAKGGRAQAGIELAPDLRARVRNTGGGTYRLALVAGPRHAGPDRR